LVTRIRLVRMNTGQTILQVSRALGTSDSMLCGIERGKIACPEWLRPKLAEYLGKKEDELFDNHGFPLFLEPCRCEASSYQTQR